MALSAEYVSTVRKRTDISRRSPYRSTSVRERWGRGYVHNFIKSFMRDNAGAWRCIAPADVELPEGRVQVTPGTVLVKGSRFMNVDLAALLDEQFSRDQRHRG
jgi:hypothetical protein